MAKAVQDELTSNIQGKAKAKAVSRLEQILPARPGRSACRPISQETLASAANCSRRHLCG
jgi:hypothetical protein